MSEKKQKNKQSEEKQLEVYKVREGEVVFDDDIEKGNDLGDARTNF